MNKDSQIEALLPKTGRLIKELYRKKILDDAHLQMIYVELSTLLNTEIEKEFLDMVEIICINSLKNAAKMFDLPIYEINQVLLKIEKRKPKSEKDSK